MGSSNGYKVVARGDGWALAWPRAEWDKLTPEQQQDVIDAQTALMSQNETENRTRRTRRPVVGVSDYLQSGHGRTAAP